jgi:hypothetical protein
VRRLSMLNFRRRYGVLIVLMCGWLLLLEGFFRIPAVVGRLRPFEQDQRWYSPYVADRIQLATQNPTADIWFIGSSVVMRGVNPAMIDPLLGQQTGQPHQSLNMALPAMINVEILRDYLNDVFLPVSQPQTMVLGVFPHLFAYLTKDFVERGGDLTRNDSWRPDRQLSWWLSQNVALYRSTLTLRYVFYQEPPEAVISDASGYMRIETSLLENTPKVITSFGNGNDMLDTNLARVETLHRFLEEQGIQMLLVNFPVYDTLVEQYPGGADNFVDYQDRLRAFAQAEQIPYCDLHQALRREVADAPLATYFEDYYHLNEQGAAAVAPLIAGFMGQNMESISASSPTNC